MTAPVKNNGDLRFNKPCLACGKRLERKLRAYRDRKHEPYRQFVKRQFCDHECHGEYLAGEYKPRKPKKKAA